MPGLVLSDVEIVQSCLAGHPGSWDDFVDRFSSLIYHTIYSTLRRYAAQDAWEELCHDLFQQAFISICEDNCRRLRSYQGKNDCSVATWLRVIVSRMAIDRLRKKELSTVPIEEDPESDSVQGLAVNPADSTPLPDEQLENEQATGFFLQELSELPAKDRLILKLVYEDGLSPQEAAKIVNIKPGALYTRISRIKEKLRHKAKQKGLV